MTTGSSVDEREEVRLGLLSLALEMQSFPCGFLDTYSHDPPKYVSLFLWNTGEVKDQAGPGTHQWALAGSGVISALISAKKKLVLLSRGGISELRADLFQNKYACTPPPPLVDGHWSRTQEQLFLKIF